jgi:hypothetical protein
MLSSEIPSEKAFRGSDPDPKALRKGSNPIPATSQESLIYKGLRASPVVRLGHLWTTQCLLDLALGRFDLGRTAWVAALVHAASIARRSRSSESGIRSP